MINDFDVIETTIGEIHEAMKAGDLSSEELTKQYLDRIKTYDKDGPELNSIITINNNAVKQAGKLDEEFAEDGIVGPLHGIPVLIKDQAETAGIRTTFGSEAFLQYVPDEDATIVSKIKDSGGIILAKTNVPDFAASYFGFSSAIGQTKNPYDTFRDPGGSSCGTGAAVAANLGTIGIGEDTGGSIRVPAANCNLYGIRVTTGLISRNRHSPIVPRQDTPGPMARTMTDMTKLLDVLVGYDSRDEWTGAVAHTNVESYTNYLNEDGLDGARVGVLCQAFGDESNPRASAVNEVVESVLKVMHDAGTELMRPVFIDELEEKLEDTAVYDPFANIVLNEFIEQRNVPYDSISEIYENNAFHKGLDSIKAIAKYDAVPEEQLDFWRKIVRQESLRQDILRIFAAHDLDTIIFPNIRVVPPKISELNTRYTIENYPTNTPVSAQSQCPSLSVPGGLTDDGLPVGVELLGVPYNEHKLIEIGYAYEQVTGADTRVPPETVPRL